MTSYDVEMTPKLPNNAILDPSCKFRHVGSNDFYKTFENEREMDQN